MRAVSGKAGHMVTYMCVLKYKMQYRHFHGPPSQAPGFHSLIPLICLAHNFINPLKCKSHHDASLPNTLQGCLIAYKGHIHGHLRPFRIQHCPSWLTISGFQHCPKYIPLFLNALCPESLLFPLKQNHHSPFKAGSSITTIIP